MFAGRLRWPALSWTPDAAHEAVRDLVRAREAATDDLRRKRQQLLSFLLRHSRIYSGGGHWTMAHRRWLANQKFEHAAQQIATAGACDEDRQSQLRGRGQDRAQLRGRRQVSTRPSVRRPDAAAPA